MNPSSLIGHITELLKLVDSSKQPADRTVTTFFRDRTYLGARDRRVISETTFGMIRHRRRIEALLEQYLIEHPEHIGLDDQTHRYLPLYAAFALDKETDQLLIPQSLWTTCFPNIDLAFYTNWLFQHQSLEFLGSDTIIQLGVKYSFQDWMVEEWLQQFQNDTEKLLQALNTSAGTSLRVNLQKASREECQRRLQEEGIETALSVTAPAGLRASKRFTAQSSQTFKDGWFEMQDEGSQLVSLIANPKPGNIVIDGCAGAGGKSLHMAELMRDEGEVVAIDVDKRRLAELQRRAERAGVKSIRTVVRDEVQPENFLGKADLVLVDAPCSGVGTIRRNPWFKWSVTESLVDHFSERQETILAFNAQFVKSGGRLAYVTCSLFRKENEDVVRRFLSAHNDFQRCQESSSAFSMTDGRVALYPHLQDTDGFIIHLLQRA